MVIPLYFSSGPQLITPKIGDSSRNVENLLKIQHPCIIFIDEADSVFKSRNSIKSDHVEMDRIVNSFLTSLDNLSNNVYIFAATNLPNLLDDAILRRFEEILEFKKPSEEDISKYVNIFNIKHNSQINIDVKDVNSLASLKIILERKLRLKILGD